MWVEGCRFDEPHVWVQGLETVDSCEMEQDATLVTYSYIQAVDAA